MVSELEIYYFGLHIIHIVSIIAFVFYLVICS